MSETGCPVCGYPAFSEFYPESGSTYEICSCCGFQSGVDGVGRDRTERNAEFRDRWLQSGALWWSTTRASPPGWSALDQLRAAGMLDQRSDDDDE